MQDSNYSGVLPTTSLDLGDPSVSDSYPNTSKLVSGDLSTGRYIVLSHCRMNLCPINFYRTRKRCDTAQPSRTLQAAKQDLVSTISHLPYKTPLKWLVDLGFGTSELTQFVFNRKTVVTRKQNPFACKMSILQPTVPLLQHRLKTHIQDFCSGIHKWRVQELRCNNFETNMRVVKFVS